MENSSHDDASAGLGSQASSVRKTNRLSFVFSVLAVAGWILIPVVRGALEDVDRQFANFGGIFCGLLGCLFLGLAILFHRSVPWFLKLLVVLLPPLSIWGFFTYYEFAGVNGEVWPTFRVRQARQSKPLPESPQPRKEAFRTDPNVAAYSFSQYLGDQRVGNVDSKEFETDWSVALPELVWKIQIGAGWSGFSVAEGLAVTLEQRDETEAIVARDLLTGDEVWAHTEPGKHENPLGGLGPRSTPTLCKSDAGWLVVAQTALGKVLCLDLLSGQLHWSIDLLELAGIDQVEAEQDVMWGRSGSPLVRGDLVYVPFGGSSKKTDNLKSLLCARLKTGEVLWTNGNMQIAYASPVVLNLDGVEQIVLVNEASAHGYDLETGNELWSTPWPSKSNGDACASQPVQVDANHLILGKGYAQGSKLIEVQSAEGEGGARTWKATDVWANTRILKTKFTSTVMHEGKAFALSDGVLECIEPMTGKRIWRGARFGQGQMLIVNGQAIVVAEDGRIVSVDAATGKTIAEMNVLEGITWNPLCVAGPYLLVRNGTEAACLKSPIRK